MKASIVRGQVITLFSSHERVWIKKTPEELEAQEQADIAAGRFYDDGGEPILYGTYMDFPRGVDTLEVTVTSLRAKWEGWQKRPKNMRTGYCAALKREVLFTAK